MADPRHEGLSSAGRLLFATPLLSLWDERDRGRECFWNPGWRSRRRPARALRRLALLHRPHPHAVEGAQGLPEEPRADPTPSAPSRSTRAGRRRSTKVETLQPHRSCSTGWTGRAATWWCRRRGTTASSSGTFSLRSPARPNPIALSVARLLKVDGTKLQVVGLDCLDGTPLIDIKPYFASTDSIPDADVGWHAARKR